MSLKSKFVKSLASLATAAALPATLAMSQPAIAAPAPTQVAAQVDFSDNFTDKMSALHSEVSAEDPSAVDWLQIFIQSFEQIIIIIPKAAPTSPTDAFAELE